MAIVSVSEAARLVGKSRRTIQRDIVAGKLSKCDNGKRLDSSELLRVYGAFSDATNVTDVAATMTHLVADNAQSNVADMRVHSAILPHYGVFRIQNQLNQVLVVRVEFFHQIVDSSFFLL